MADVAAKGGSIAIALVAGVKYLEERFPPKVDKIENALSGVSERSLWLRLAADGYSAERIRELVFSIARGVLRAPQEQLEALGVGLLAPFAEDIVKTGRHPWGLAGLEACTQIFRASYAADSKKTLACYAEWYEEVDAGHRKHWSIAQLEQDHSKHDLEEYAISILRDIGAVVEASIQPQLKQLLQHVRIAGRREMSSEIPSKLGVVVSELRKQPSLEPLLVPQPWSLRLSDWRNAAQHMDVEIRGERIVCHYHVGADRHSVELSRGELWEVGFAIEQVRRVLWTARRAFLIDHLTELRSVLVGRPDRVDDQAQQIAIAIGTQGFEVTSLRFADDMASVVVEERTKQPPSDRRWHAIQFVLQFWNQSEVKTVKLEYRDLHGASVLHCLCPAEACRRLHAREIDREGWLRAMTLVDGKTGQTMVPVPR